ncbi:HAMP domain-containing protein [Chthonobacter albigriseus]|uniref:HAMP domain-containing protein n=1 Tax=Chthonobacter albigriseus TaxID=1683161 RepID=UPI0015EFCF0F|nr:HAMP domain-containing protein [Chthonobacter albigriseus]
MLSRMRFATRIGVVGAVMAVPIVLLGYLLIIQVAGTVDFSSREREGSRLLADVWNTYSMALTQEGQLTPELQGSLGRLESAGLREWVRQARGDTEPIDQFVAAIKSGDLRLQLSTGKVLIQAISDHSNMTLDPNLDTYYLMDALVFRIPLMADMADQIHQAVEAAHATAGPPSHDVVRSVIAADANYRSGLADLRRSLALAIDGNPDGSLAAPIRAPMEAAVSASEAFLATSSPFVAAVMDGKPLADGAAVIEPAEHETQEGLRTLWSGANAEFDRLVAARVDGLLSVAMIEAIAVLVTLAAAALMVLVIARSIARQVTSVAETLVALGRGELDTAIPYQDLRNEIGTMARRFALSAIRWRRWSGSDASGRPSRRFKPARTGARRSPWTSSWRVPPRWSRA